MPEEDRLKKELVFSLYEDRSLIKKNEEKLLDLLNNSRGMILDDVELIESLKVSKEITKTINDKINIAMKKEEAFI
jgi:dynein heavy chain